MSEFESVSSSERAATDLGQPDLPSAAVDISAGTLLRQAREAAGLHIAALAVSLKVPVKKLEALEAGRFELLPDAVFVRALAASVCRTLKIDPAPVLQRLPKNGSPKPTYKSVSINAPFRAPGDGPGPSVWTHISRPAVLAGLVLLLGALVLIFLPAVKSGIRDVTSESTGVAGNAESAVAPAGAATAEAISAAAVKQSSANGEDMPSMASTADSAVLHSDGSAPSVSSAPATMQTASSPVPGASTLTSLAPALAAPSAVASATPPSSATGVVVFRAKGESWVEVTDAKGIVVLRRMLVPGDIVGASGVLPLAAVVGRVDATEVKIRGKTFDLAAFAKDNVARFEVK